MSRTKTLYHFTCLAYLPKILAEGITKGEVPIALNQSRNAANLTANPDQMSQHWAKGSCFDKTRIRLRCEVPSKLVISWREVQKQFKVSSEWVRILDPHKEGKNWFFALGGVSPAMITAVQIQVELGDYETATFTKKVLQSIKKEFDRAIGINEAGEHYYKSKTSWLFDAA